jgi:hypothetical protein
MMQRLQARIAKQLAEFRKSNTAPDYEEQARIILLLMIQDRLAEIREWREQHVGGSPTEERGRDGTVAATGSSGRDGWQAASGEPAPGTKIAQRATSRWREVLTPPPAAVRSAR